MDQMLRQLHAITPSQLSADDRLTYAVIREAVESEADLRVCRSELWTVNHYGGWQVQALPHLTRDPLVSPENRAAFLLYWSALPHALVIEQANLREGLRLGFSAPKRTVELVLQQLDGVLAAPDDRSPLLEPVRRDADAEFQRAWRALVTDSIRPAMTGYATFLRTHYLAAARDAISIRGNPNGAECYAALTRHYVTRQLAPDSVFAIGERTVASYDSIIVAKGAQLYGTSNRDSIGRLATRSHPAPFASRAELLAYTDSVLSRAQAALPRFFGYVPTTPLVVRAVPDYLESTAPPARYELPRGASGRGADGRERNPGVYLVNTAHPERQDRLSVERTSFHEGFPGHHLQLSIAAERAGATGGDAQLNSGFLEGWARYAESLADEMGLYQVPGGSIARLLWPAHGIVLDAGVHVNGWTREQALAYMATVTASTSGNEQLVDRVAAIPGQLASYDLGAHEFFALRRAAESALGSRFDIRAFHDQLLGYGVVPLAVLHERVTRWIAQERAPGTP